MSIYCLVEKGSTSPIKIGFTTGNKARISNTHNPRQLVSLGFFDGGRDLEKYLHTKFEDKRVVGGGEEWFNANMDDVREALFTAQSQKKSRLSNVVEAIHWALDNGLGRGEKEYYRAGRRGARWTCTTGSDRWPAFEQFFALLIPGTASKWRNRSDSERYAIVVWY